MIHIDFSLAITIYLFLTTVLAIGHWIFYTYNDKDTQATQSKYLEQCPYCTYLFFDYTDTKLKICPRCESYIAAEELQKNSQE